MSSYFQVFDTGIRPVFIFDSSKSVVYQNEKSIDLTGKSLVGAKSIQGLGDHLEDIILSVGTCLSGKGPCEISQIKLHGHSFKALFNNAMVEEKSYVVLTLEDIIAEASKDNDDLELYEKALRALGRVARNPEEKWNFRIEMGLEAAIDFLGLPMAIVSRINEDSYTVVAANVIEGDPINPGTRFDLGGTYCDVTWKSQSMTSSICAGRDPIFREHPSYQSFNLETYIGIPLHVNSKPFGTLNFSSPESRGREFSKGEVEFLKILAKWIEGVLESHEGEKRNRHLASQSETVQTLFEGVFNESPIAIGVGSVDRKLQIVNRSFLELYGLKEEEIFGRCTSTLYANPEDYKGLGSRFSKDNNQVDYNSYTIQYRRSDGSTFMGETIGYPVHNKNKEVIGFIAQVIDKTDELRRTKELEEQRIITQQNSKLAAIGELAAGVGHEINNPLQIMNGHLSLIFKKLEEDSSIRPGLEKIDCALKRIAKIVEELRTFSRKDEVKTSFNIVSAINETVFLLKQIYLKHGVTLEVEIEEAGLFIYGNKGKFHQVVVNLLSNARDATEDQEHRLIKVTVSKEDTKAKIVVRDNGKGIKEEDLDKIFNPFFTTKSPKMGTGIGLSVTHKIIKEHDGQISCKSSPGRGCEFTVKLPLVLTETSEKIESVKSIEQPIAPFKSALIVDDELEIGEVLADFFEEEGVQATLVESAEQALKVLSQENNFDIVLSDMQMEGMTGLELLEVLKVMEPGVKRVLMTGGVDQDAKENSRMLDLVDLVLYKPFSPELAFEKLSELYVSS